MNIMKTRTWVIAILVLSFLGLADASYLAQHAVAGTPLICNIQNLSGCNIVASSQYSRVFGVPIAVYGVIFYGLLFVLSALELVIFDRLLRRVLQVISAAGFIASVYFILVQIFLIGAFCIYCFVSAVIAVIVLGCATRIEPLPLRKRDGGPAAAPKPPFYKKMLSKREPKVPFANGSKDLQMPPEA